MNSDPERWMAAMKTEMDTLRAKHTWDLVKLPTGANIMDSMWIYDIKWDGEGNHIKERGIYNNWESTMTRLGGGKKKLDRYGK